MWFPGRKEGETEESYGAVHRDGDFSIKGGNLGEFDYVFESL